MGCAVYSPQRWWSWHSAAPSTKRPTAAQQREHPPRALKFIANLWYTEQTMTQQTKRAAQAQKKIDKIPVPTDLSAFSE